VIQSFYRHFTRLRRWKETVISVINRAHLAARKIQQIARKRLAMAQARRLREKECGLLESELEEALDKMFQDEVSSASASATTLADINLIWDSFGVNEVDVLRSFSTEEVEVEHRSSGSSATSHHNITTATTTNSSTSTSTVTAVNLQAHAQQHSGNMSLQVQRYVVSPSHETTNPTTSSSSCSTSFMAGDEKKGKAPVAGSSWMAGLLASLQVTRAPPGCLQPHEILLSHNSVVPNPAAVTTSDTARLTATAATTNARVGR
jgi:hypothetical protein